MAIDIDLPEKSKRNKLTQWRVEDFESYGVFYAQYKFQLQVV